MTHYAANAHHNTPPPPTHTQREAVNKSTMCSVMCVWGGGHWFERCCRKSPLESNTSLLKTCLRFGDILACVFKTFCTLIVFQSLHLNLKQMQRELSEEKQLKNKKTGRQTGRRKHTEQPQILPSPCKAPPGSRCPEGGSRRTNPTHHLSPEQPGAASFTLQSLPI